MAGLGLSGLASGVDTSGIVDRLMAIERQSLTRIQVRQSQVQTRQTGLRDIQAKLTSLATAAAELRASSLWANTQTVTSADATKVGIERRAEGPAGTYQLAVQQLAKPTQKSYAYTSPTLLSAPAGSSIQIGDKTVAVAAGATVDQVASSINATSGISVFASTQAGRLVLTSRVTGGPATSDFAASGAALADEQVTNGQDAMYTVDGVARTSSSNVVDDALVGSRVTLKSVTAPGTAIALTVTQPAIDKDAVKAKVKAFVEAYNSVVTTVRARTQEKVDPAATSGSAALRGQLRGDSALVGILARLRTTVTDVVAGNPDASDQLADLGVSTGRSTGAATSADARAGLLVFDEVKFGERMAADPESVKRLMGAVPGVDGFAQKVDALLDAQDPILDGRVASGDSELRRLSSTLVRAGERLEVREKRLRAQFTAMESALLASQNMQSRLSGQLDALYR